MFIGDADVGQPKREAPNPPTPKIRPDAPVRFTIIMIDLSTGMHYLSGRTPPGLSCLC
jgi:hypothetical protein